MGRKRGRMGEWNNMRDKEVREVAMETQKCHVDSFLIFIFINDSKLLILIVIYKS